MKLNSNHWVIAFILIALLGAMAGCNPEAKQLRKTQEYLFKHPDFTAGVCAEQFETKPDSVIVYETKTDTLWELLQFYDTTSTNDTIKITDHKTKVVTKTIWRDSIIYRENKAEQHRLELALLSCQDNNNAWLNKYSEQERLLAEWKGKAKKRWMWIALLIGGAAAFTAFKVFKTVKGV